MVKIKRAKWAASDLTRKIHVHIARVSRHLSCQYDPSGMLLLSQRLTHISLG